VERELMLVKVRAEGETRARVLEICDVFRVRVADVTHHTLTVEATGQPDKMAALLSLLGDFGIVELARTGRVALSRGDRGIRERMLKAARAVGGEDVTDWDGGGV
jgi:acetolactate synthase-1/3 small subunit